MICIEIESENEVLIWGAYHYTIHPGENLLHKHKTIKCDVMGERAATKYIQISWTD